LEKLYTQKQRMQDTLVGKLYAIECDKGNVECAVEQYKGMCLRYSVFWLEKSRREQENHGLHRK
jgi:hypothetical protein